MKNLSIRWMAMAACATLVLTACDSNGDEASEQPKVGVNVAYGLFQQSRSTDMDTWDMYDQIGITMCYHAPASHAESAFQQGVYYDPTSEVQPFNRCYYTTTAGSSEFTYRSAQHKIWFPTDTTTVDFIAYYPYSDQVTLDRPIYDVRLEGQASSGEALASYDLMWGQVLGLDKGNSAVVIPFRHQLTQVICYIKPMGDLTIGMLADATVALSHQKSRAHLNVLTDEMVYDEGDCELILINAPMVIDGDSCLMARAIILPNHNVQNPVSYVETDDRQESLDKNRHIVLSIPALDGKKMMANLKATEFKPGEKHVFHLEAQVNQLLLVRGEIVEWETIVHDETTIID